MNEVIEVKATPMAAASPATLVQLAIEQGADLDRLERLMKMQREWEADQARKAYNEAFAAFKSEPIQIFKRQIVDFTSAKGRTQYKHANLADVTDALGAAMAKHSLAYRWDVRQDGKSVTVECIVSHNLGHRELVSMSAPARAST